MILPAQYKVDQVAELKQLFDGAEAVFVAEYRGLTVAQASALRKAIREAGGKAKVARNRLAEIALDEVGVYYSKVHITDVEKRHLSLFSYMTEVVSNALAGSGGVIFTPWLHGNRCPFEDPYSRGMFFNISLETGKTELIRAVLEGVCYHKRWMLESCAVKVKPSDTIRFVGGGALSDFTCQLLADVTGHRIETVDSPQNVGAMGAAACVGVGIGAIENFDKIKDYIPASKTFEPNISLKIDVYDKGYEVFKTLYKTNKKNFAILNKCED